MEEHRYALFGIVGPLTAYFFIVLSIVLSPWFDWCGNALSDLGHATRSGAAPVYNFGLMLSGFLIIIYSITVFRNHAKLTGYCLVSSAIFLQLVAAFDEVYGSLHFIASVLLFASFIVASIAYTFERKSILSLIAFFVSLISWMLYWAKIYSAGIAVPEMISSLATASWVIFSAFKIYRGK